MQLSSKKVLLLGLGGLSGERIEKALAGCGGSVQTCEFHSAGQGLGLIEQLSPDVVFCAAEPDRYLPLLQAVRQSRSAVSVVVVGSPEVSAWLDALEAGASDYCSPPFEDRHLHWIVQSAVRPRPFLEARAVA